jgi:bis(5'-nucleosyl)-tetraphosphatase (symmetrical)
MANAVTLQTVRWVVGDVQGCARELERLLASVRFDPARDELWSVGDLINRGPDSVAVLRLWRDVGGHAVIGNHEVYALGVRSGRIERRADRLGALFAASDLDEHLARLRALPALVHLPAEGGTEAWLVHAGIHPAWSDLQAAAARLNAEPHDDAWLAREELRFATRARFCTALGERSPHTGPPAECPAGFRPWDEFYAGPVLVAHGHWATRGVYRGRRTLGLDSGCVYGGALTAWCQQEDRLVSVPAG